MRTWTLLALPALAVILQGLPAGAEERIDFAHDVVPVLKARCGQCHTNGTYKGDVSFDTRAALLKSEAAVPGQSAKSLLIERVAAKEARLRMPPKGDPLTAKQIATLRAWIDQGLPWQEGYSFAEAPRVVVIAPRRPELPPAVASRDNPIDRIIDAYHAQEGIPTPPTVEDSLFLRRLHMDVVGLLPTVAEQDAFLADASADKRQRLIRKVLADRRGYAEHWLTFWNDLLRNDYAGTGYIDGGRQQITDWLYRSLMENKPYDVFVRELIDPAPEAEGFIRGIKWRGRVNASQKREVQFAQNVAQVFLGLNLKCASCHDSFINEWKLKDAYGMAAVVADEPLEIHRCDKPTGETAKAKFLFPTLGEIDPSRPSKERLGRLAELMASPKNGLFARTIVNRLWQRLMGRGIVHPVDMMENPPWSADLLDYLATHLVENEYDLKKTLELIVSSQAYQARSAPLSGDKDLAEEYEFRGPIARRLTAEQFVDAVWRLTGTAPARPAAKVGGRGGEPVRASLVVADPLMRSLGRPNREQVVTTRPEDLSTLQALDLTNGQILAGLLELGAKNLRKRHPEWDADQMARHVFRSALGRKPGAEERGVARQLLGEPMTDEGLSDLLWATVMLPEFQLVR